MVAYTVTVGSFEGPFDLLLHLIARRRLDIHEVSLAQITDDYLAVLRELDDVDLEVTTEFLVVAATLVELKAARLLPGTQDPELEELAIEARDLLYARLLDYRMFATAATWIEQRLTAAAGHWPRRVRLDPDLAALAPPTELGVTAAGLARIAARALAERPAATVDVGHLAPVRMTVREAAVLVLDEVDRAGGRATLGEVSAGCRHTIERIVYFLAVLELTKHELLDVAQHEPFGDIMLVRLADGRLDHLDLDAYDGIVAPAADPSGGQDRRNRADPGPDRTDPGPNRTDPGPGARTDEAELPAPAGAEPARRRAAVGRHDSRARGSGDG